MSSQVIAPEGHYIPDDTYYGSIHPSANSSGGANSNDNFVWQDNVSYAGMDGTLLDELVLLDGIHAQNPETGGRLDSDQGAMLKNYTNRLFGCPFQLLDSVDKRFKSINPNVGSEYMKHFLLHSPILHIRPGMPRYTGGEAGLGDVFRDAYATSASGSDRGVVSSFMQSIAERTIFGGGSKLQRRMFGFREDYNGYMMYVNYMCRVVGELLGITNNPRFPNGTHISGDSFTSFETIRWENYRMSGESVNTNSEQLMELFRSSFVGGMAKSVLDTASSLANNDGDISSKISGYVESVFGTENNNMYEAGMNKITSVQFMVEPTSFQESLSNQTGQSFIEGAMDGITGIGTEIAFITNSGADIGVLGELAGVIGNTAADALQSIAGAVSPVTGGFLTNLFSGALSSITGQKMIYPEIYKSSNSEMNYEFTVNLSSPYGDIYNYYMNIVVPLLHLVALAAPRMVTSNTVASPFLVQAFIPGMCTCQLGIISNMTIAKNRNTSQVSVNGFPLSVTVNFTIKELYNALSISPANDPASFLFNETLNDYMANMAGIIPSRDTDVRIRDIAWQQVGTYFSQEMGQDMASNTLEWIENVFMGQTR